MSIDLTSMSTDLTSMSVQPPNKPLDSVLEDQEQSTRLSSQPTLSSLLPPIGSTTSLAGRKKSFANRSGFGMSAIPAIAAAQAQVAVLTSHTPLDTIQSVPESTLTPNPGSANDRPVSRVGAISLDESPKDGKAGIISEPQVVATGNIVRKKYNVPESTRSQSFIRKDVGRASVGSYDPYPDNWLEKRHSIAWSRSNAVRFSKSKTDYSLGPGSYNPTFDYVHPRHMLDMGLVAFKSPERTSKVPDIAEIGPTTYSVEIVRKNRGFIPWVKRVQNTLSRIIDFKDPVKSTSHIQLIAQVAESPSVISKTTQTYTNTSKPVVVQKPLHPLHPHFLKNPA